MLQGDRHVFVGVPLSLDYYKLYEDDFVSHPAMYFSIKKQEIVYIVSKKSFGRSIRDSKCFFE